jgi:hypothetical protein
MAVAEYARILELQGASIRLVGGTYWRQVRPFFYRPVLLYNPVPLPLAPPPRSVFGGYQHVVKWPSDANSTIAFRVYAARPYALEKQWREHRRMVRAAANRFELRVIRDPDELKHQGYAAYMSFYGRTQYSYLAERRRPDRFGRWVGSFFGSPNSVVLGAYADRTLRAVSVLFRIEDLLLYSTSFSDTWSLKQHVSDLMLDAVRESAAREPAIRVIVAGMYGGGTGPDRFDILRGATVERRPARCVFVPAALGSCVRMFFPEQFRKVKGDAADWRPRAGSSE